MIIKRFSKSDEELEDKLGRKLNIVGGLAATGLGIHGLKKILTKEDTRTIRKLGTGLQLTAGGLLLFGDPMYKKFKKKGD